MQDFALRNVFQFSNYAIDSLDLIAQKQALMANRIIILSVVLALMKSYSPQAMRRSYRNKFYLRG